MGVIRVLCETEGGNSMRRPLFVVALCVVMITAIRLKCGWVAAGGAVSGEGNGPVAGSTVEVIGQVYQKDVESIYLKNVILCDSNVSEVSVADSQQEISNLICEVKNAGTIPLGSKVRLSGVFAPFYEATNPGEFNSAVYYRTLGIGGKLKDVQLQAKTDGEWKIRECLFDLKSQLQKRLYSALAPENAAIMEALLLGEKGNLDGDIKELYKRNGILHILSISSLHITIIGMSVYKLLRRVGCPIWPAAVAGAVLLLLYGCMTGFGVSATRAIGMYLLRMFAEVVGRTYDMLTALGVMAAVMVMQNPYYLQHGGFLLSFSCVLGIGVVYPALLPELGRYQSDNRPHTKVAEKIKDKMAQMEWGNRALKAFWAGLSVSLATLPVQLYLYYEVPVWSVFLNLLVIPCLEPLMILGVLTLAVPGMSVFGGAVAVVLRWYEFLCETLEKLPVSTWNPGCPNIWQITVYYILFGVVLVMWRRGKRYARKGGGMRYMVGACILAVAIVVLGNRTPSENRVFFLDVGQGDCILVQTASGENYLFDCGSSSRGNVGKYVLLPFLKYHGIHKLDGVFVSHPDVDHAGGVLELLEFAGENHISIGQVVLPHVAAATREKDFADMLQAVSQSPLEGIALRYVAKGDKWKVGSARFLCLHPERDSGETDSNAYSQCFLVQFDTCNLLLTGDISVEQEGELTEVLRREGVASISVLKVAHHGSRYSNSEEFLQEIQPVVAVISCGRNVYGHPHEETLKRLEAAGSEIKSTLKSGQITIEVEEGRMRISGFLRQNR